MAGHKEGFPTHHIAAIQNHASICCLLALTLTLHVNLVHSHKDWFLALPLHNCQICVPGLPACIIQKNVICCSVTIMSVNLEPVCNLQAKK